jgi:hypothetical protein
MKDQAHKGSPPGAHLLTTRGMGPTDTCPAHTSNGSAQGQSHRQAAVAATRTLTWRPHNRSSRAHGAYPPKGSRAVHGTVWG